MPQTPEQIRKQQKAVAVIREALNDPGLRARIAHILRFEFADLERQVMNQNRLDPEL